jgi:hypothetical protein
LNKKDPQNHLRPTYVWDKPAKKIFIKNQFADWQNLIFKGTSSFIFFFRLNFNRTMIEILSNGTKEGKIVTKSDIEKNIY